MMRFRFSIAALVAALLVAALGFAAVRSAPEGWFSAAPESAIMTDHRPFSWGEELELIEQIRKTSSAEQRSRLISQLDKLPVKFHPFYSRWWLINDLDPFPCWTDDGYDPSLANCPRDIQLLIATDYGKSDIENGGFHQFFSNPTGVVAPEMIEWFERAGLPESASVLREATALFGKGFPRSQAARREFLTSFDGATRADWDPFFKLDDRFYASVPMDKDKFEAAADRWLREVCGIANLHVTLVEP
jgi:hypothetical protein